MADPPTWQGAFVAATFALGGSLEDAAAALGAADRATAGVVFKGLAAGTRDARARALAAALGRAVADLERARIA